MIMEYAVQMKSEPLGWAFCAFDEELDEFIAFYRDIARRFRK